MEETVQISRCCEKLENSPEITQLVGHSLGSAVISTIKQDQPSKFDTTTYATPAIKPKRKGKTKPKKTRSV